MRRLRGLGLGGRLVLALAVGGAVFGIATAVQAAIPDAQGVIHGCYQKVNGQLRVVDTATGQSCNPSEVPLNWSQKGTTGARGPTGTKGTTGARGPTGTTGSTGTPGTRGATGPTGANGVRGPTGPDGTAGAVDQKYGDVTTADTSEVTVMSMTLGAGSYLLQTHIHVINLNDTGQSWRCDLYPGFYVDDARGFLDPANGRSTDIPMSYAVTLGASTDVSVRCQTTASNIEFYGYLIAQRVASVTNH